MTEKRGREAFNWVPLRNWFSIKLFTFLTGTETGVFEVLCPSVNEFILSFDCPFEILSRKYENQ